MARAVLELGVSQVCAKAPRNVRDNGVVMSMQVIEGKLLEVPWSGCAGQRLKRRRPRHRKPFSPGLVSAAFEGVSAVQRQRLVFACLSEELAGPVHALQMKCMTPAEYEAADGESP